MKNILFLVFVAFVCGCVRNIFVSIGDTDFKYTSDMEVKRILLACVAFGVSCVMSG